MIQKTLKNDHTLLVAFLLLHAFLWTLIPTIFHPNIPLDVAEISAWGKEWQLGYYKHPPLVPWLSELASDLFGRSASSYFLLSQLCILLGMLFTWQLAEHFLSKRQAILSVMLLEGIYYYNFTSIEFNHNVILLLLWPWMLWAFWLALEKQSIRYWLLFAMAAAMGMLAKYFTAVLLLAMVLLVVFSAHFRKKTLTHAAPYLAACLFILVLLPHIFWLIAHDFITLDYIVNRTASEKHWWHHMLYPLKFALSQLLSVLALLLIIATAFGRKLPSGETDPHKRLFLLWMCCMPFIITIIFSVVTGAKLRSMWGTPLWGMLGMVIIYLYQSTLKPMQERRIIIGVLTAMFIGLLAHMLTYSASPHKRAHFNGVALSKAIAKHWEKALPNQSLEIIAGNTWLAGNIAFYHADHPSVWVDMLDETSPWIDSASIRKSGAVILWPIGQGGGRAAALSGKAFSVRTHRLTNGYGGNSMAQTYGSSAYGDRMGYREVNLL